MPDPYVALPWRVGSQVLRTLYVDHPAGEKHPEQLFGLVDTAELAAHIVEIHNRYLNIDEAGDAARAKLSEVRFDPEGLDRT